METNQSKSEIAKQIKSAFDFLQKLYNESSYLIKEIEGQLSESEPKFQILKPSGYSVSARSSTGLEPNNVSLWLLRKFAVAFVEASNPDLQKGQNTTEINENLKILYFRIILDDKNQSEPHLIFGVFYEIKQSKEWVKKFENLMGQFEYVDSKLFAKFPNIDYEDGTFKIKGKFKKVNLLEIDSSDELIEKVINPSIKLYEKTE
jgi:hypothetical protein